MSGLSLRKILLSLAVATPLALSGNTHASPFIEKALVIRSNDLVFQGRHIPIPIRRKDLIRAFGRPSRKVYDAAGNVLIWDKLGLSCFDCKKPNLHPEELKYMTPVQVRAFKPNDQIGALMIYLRKYDAYHDSGHKQKYNHQPRYSFPGYVKLQGVVLDGTTSIKKFIADRNSKQTILLPNNSFSFYIRCKPAPQEITLYTVRDQYSDDYLNIYAVSIRNVGQFYKKFKCRENFEAQEKKRLELKKLEEEQLMHPGQQIKRPIPMPARHSK